MSPLVSPQYPSPQARFSCYKAQQSRSWIVTCRSPSGEFLTKKLYRDVQDFLLHGPQSPLPLPTSRGESAAQTEGQPRCLPGPGFGQSAEPWPQHILGFSESQGLGGPGAPGAHGLSQWGTVPGCQGRNGPCSAVRGAVPVLVFPPRLVTGRP